MDLVYVGKIVNTHGVKGELRIKSDFEKKDLVFKVGNKIIIDSEEHTIRTYRFHKIFDMITIDELININDVLCYVGKELYVPHDREELEEGEFFYEDLIGLDCYDSKENYIGPIIDLQEVPQGLILEIKGKEKTILVPFVEAFIDGIDLEENKLFINEIEGLL